MYVSFQSSNMANNTFHILRVKWMLFRPKIMWINSDNGWAERGQRPVHDVNQDIYIVNYETKRREKMLMLVRVRGVT